MVYLLGVIELQGSPTAVHKFCSATSALLNTAVTLIPFLFLVFPALGSLENFARFPITNRSEKWSCNWELGFLVTVRGRK